MAIDYLVAMTVYLKKEDLSKIEAMLLQHPWWDSIDAFSEVISKMVIQEPVLKQEMLRWSTSESLWLRRSAIIHQLLFEKADGHRTVADHSPEQFWDQRIFYQ